MKKKKVTVVLSLGAAALLLIGGISVYAHQTSDSGESETVYKETTAEYGTLTVGITESGSVTIGSISQDMAEDISTSSNSGSSQTSGTQTTGTSTNNSSVALEVEEVYVSVGQVMEVLRQRGVRLIAINDGVDSLKGDDDFTPFRNIMNEFYARDTSRKIRSVFKSKGMSGKHLTGTVIYGYLWDEKREHWLVDEEAAEVVRRIFSLTLEG